MRCLSSFADIIGVSVNETTAETRIVTARVIANSRNSRPTMSPMNSNGMSTAISETVSEIIVKPICADPFNAASSGESPLSRNRSMFSIITIASSTTNPVEMVNAINVRLLRLYPSRYITPNVPISESGTATLGITVAARFRRNTNTTITTSAMASINSNSTSFTEARIVVVRSVRICTFTALGRAACNCGSRVLIRSTTLMMLAPGCRWIFMITAGVKFIHAAS